MVIKIRFSPDFGSFRSCGRMSSVYAKSLILDLFTADVVFQNFSVGADRIFLSLNGSVVVVGLTNESITRGSYYNFTFNFVILVFIET